MSKNILLLIVVLLSGCQVGPKYTPPISWVPEKWKNETTECCEAKIVACWWEIFEDEKLNELEALALTYNKDLYAAFERIVQARSVAGIALSDTLPQFSAEPFYTNEGILWMLYDPVRVIREHRRRNHIPFVINYEVDLWGKLAKAYESAEYHLEGEIEAYQTAMLVLTTDLAISYFQLRALDAEIKFYENTLKAYEKEYQIVKERYKKKITNYYDVTRVEYNYKDTQAQFFNIKRLRDLEENKLAVLLGMPASDFKIESNPLQNLPPIIPSGVPSDVLLQRPDIAQAERERASEHALINVAYASFFPSLSLTAAAGYSSPELKDFLKPQSGLWALGANSFMPLIDTGNYRSNVELAVARFREADANYQQQVLLAFQEVEDALANLEGLKNEYGSVQLSVEAAKKTYEIAFDRYRNQITFYLDVADSERQLYTAQQHLIEILYEQYQATIQLIKSLGGSWSCGLE